MKTFSQFCTLYVSPFFVRMPKKKNVTSVLEVMDITTGQRSVVKIPF